MGWTGAGCRGRGRGLELHPLPLWALFWPPFMTCGILAPRPGISRPLAVRAWSPNLWNSPGNSRLYGFNLNSLINLLVPERNWVEPQTLTPLPFAHSVRLDPPLGVFLQAHLPVRSLDQEPEALGVKRPLPQPSVAQGPAFAWPGAGSAHRTGPGALPCPAHHPAGSHALPESALI